MTIQQVVSGIVACGMLVAVAGPVCAYPENYLSAKLGASVSTEGTLWGDHELDAILSDGPISKGGFSFADIEQHQVFTVDLGQTREFDRMQSGSSNAGDDRTPELLKIEVSDEGPNGPYRTVIEKTDIGYLQVLRLPLVKARWVRFDLGTGAKGKSVHALRLYKGYEHPKLEEVTKLLHERIQPDVPGLEKFYKAADAEDWTSACRELRAYYTEKHKTDPPDPNHDLSRAEALEAGKIEFAGFSRQETVPIDWSYSRTTDWYEHKNFLNRGAPIGIPANAHYNTGDKRWADLFRSIFYDWIDANPKPEVMSRADYPTWRTLDSALRAGWLHAIFPRVTAGKHIEDELWANLLYTLWEHADYLKNDNFSGGNWLAMVSGSVMDTAVRFPEFKDLKDWLAYGKEAFEMNVMRDVHPDGKEREDAPGYMCMAYAGMFGTLQLLDKAEIPVSDEARERMNKVLDVLGAALQPNGEFPNIGDWGGPIPFSLNPMMEYFKREDTRYILTKGKEGTVPAAASVNFPHGGWSIMRSPYEEQPYENARHLLFKSSADSHGHLDVLQITAYAYGRELLIDPGIRSYEGADVERYLHTSYHNTICVDGKSKSQGAGQTEMWVSNSGLDYVFGTHPAYRGLVHRRSVTFVKPEYWVVHDDILGETDHTYDQNWMFAEDAGLTEDPATKAVRTSFPTGGNLLMVPADPESLASRSVDFFIAKNRMSADEDGQVPSKAWRYSKSGTAPQVFDIVLYPYSGAEAPKVSVKRLNVSEPDPVDVTALEIRIGDNIDYLFVSRSGVRSISAPEERISVEGQVVLIRTRDGNPVGLSGANIRSVSISGRELYVRYPPEADVDTGKM